MPIARLQSLKLTFSPLKIGAPWKRRFLLETTICRGELLVLGGGIQEKTLTVSVSGTQTPNGQYSPYWSRHPNPQKPGLIFIFRNLSRSHVLRGTGGECNNSGDDHPEWCTYFWGSFHLVSFESIQSFWIPPLKLTFLPLKMGLPKRKVVFQPSIFRGYVSFRGCTWTPWCWCWNVKSPEFASKKVEFQDFHRNTPNSKNIGS